MHEGGKIEVLARMPVADRDDLSMAYTPGVARVCTEIEIHPERVHELTIKKNTVAIVTDGTAVLGLGDIGPEASLPVMEGKALLFKKFAGVDGFPICIDAGRPTRRCRSGSTPSSRPCERIAPVFGGINLEDIAAPACFEVEDRLRELLDIPVFHDDQHGTAVVTLAALENALKIVGKKMARPPRRHRRRRRRRRGHRQDPHGRRGAPTSCATDRKGAIHKGRDRPQRRRSSGSPRSPTPSRSAARCQDVLPGADVFIGVSAPDLHRRRRPPQDGRTTRSCSPWPTPTPRSGPELAKDLVAVMATGRSDYPNQINNVLAFPGIFRGALDAGATDDHREHEAWRRPRPSPRRCRPRSCVPASSSRRCSTPAWASWSPPRWPRPLGPTACAATSADPLKAVTFDFWNTLIRADDAGVRDRRLTAWLGLLAGEGFDLERRRGAARAMSHASSRFDENWKRNQYYGAADAVDDMLVHLGSRSRRPPRDGLLATIADPDPAHDPQPTPNIGDGARGPAVRRHPHRHHLRRGPGPVHHAAPLPRRPRPARVLRPLVVHRRGRHLQARPGDLRPRPRPASAASTRPTPPTSATCAAPTSPAPRATASSPSATPASTTTRARPTTAPIAVEGDAVIADHALLLDALGLS